MPRIRCHYTDCVFLDDGSCGAAAVEFDPDTGCATYAPNEDAANELLLEDEELEEWEDEEEEEEDSWLDEDEDEI
jgi:hypothetical protein